jgi:hypothetical protein
VKIAFDTSVLVAALIEAASRLRADKRETVLTAILLASDEQEAWSRCIDELDRGSLHIDDEFLLALNAVGDRKLKLALASSVAASRMKPRGFRKLFDPTYERSDLTVRERRELMWSLESFLILNPRQAPAYANTILELARSPHLDLCIRGIPMAARFTRMDVSSLEMLLKTLKSRKAPLRGSALEGCYHLAERLDEVARNVRDFILSEAFRRQVLQMQRSDPDEFVRHNAWSVLKRLPRAVGAKERHRPGTTHTVGR